MQWGGAGLGPAASRGRPAWPGAGILLGGTPAGLGGLAAAAPLAMGGPVAALLGNRVFVAGFLGWFAAQSLKIPTTFIKTGKWKPKAFFTSGGMPSSHSALCMAITSSVATLHGLGSSLFPICLGFSLIVMYDGQGVRRQAGRQAEVLNVVRNELLGGHPVAAFGELKELLGHTPMEILCGAVLGVAVGVTTVALG